MKQPNIPVELVLEGNWHIATFLERQIVGVELAKDIGQYLLNQVEKIPITQLILDFTQVEYLSSAILGSLITLHRKIEQQHGRVRAIGLGAELLRIFVVTGLREVFEIFDSRDAALSD